jgi:hypothetical protein
MSTPAEDEKIGPERPYPGPAPAPGAGEPLVRESGSVGPPIPDAAINRLAGIGGLVLVGGGLLVALIVLLLVLWLVVSHLGR